MHSYTLLLVPFAGLVASAAAQESSHSASATSSAASAVGSVISSAVSSSLTVTGSAATSTFSQSNVPTGTPLPGNYGGAYRPQVHFSPPQGFVRRRRRWEVQIQLT